MEITKQSMYDYDKITACLAGIFGGTTKGISLLVVTAQAQITTPALISVSVYAAVSALSALVVKKVAEWIIKEIKSNKKHNRHVNRG